MIEFDGVVPTLNLALHKRGYTELTPVQTAVLEEKIDDADALVSAQTGSGKTVAFGLAIAPNMLNAVGEFIYADAPLGLVVAPTRELALQVKSELDWLYRETGATITSCVGGMDIRQERRALKAGAHIVVGTPGRLNDHIRRKAFDTTQIKAVVLDEADEMLKMGFKEELEFILDATPKERRTLLFSATVPPAIAKLAKQYQRDAIRITTTAEKSQHVDIEYRALSVAPREHNNAIINVLRYYDAKNAIVFCNTRATVNHMMTRLNNRGFSVVAISGELTQTERSNALQSMRDGRAKICIATDVAARGIDLPNLDLVIHADLPTNPERLLHRSGRTGRAGRKGTSILMIDHKIRSKAERLLRLAKINANWATPPSADDVIARDEERLMTDEMFTNAIEQNELDMVERLTESFSQEQLAGAIVRMSRTGKSAPEDIEIVNFKDPGHRDFSNDKGSRDGGREKRQRSDFENSVWISLSVGRKQNAEPRWLIPMLCKAGNITKAALGTIKMQPSETYVELDADEADTFFTAIGSKKTIDKNIRVTKLDSKPKFDETKPFEKGNSRKPKEDRKPRGDRKQRDDNQEWGDKKEYKDYGDKKRRNKSQDTRTLRQEGGEFVNEKPRRKRPPKPTQDGNENKFSKPSFGDAPAPAKSKKPKKNKAAGKGGWAKKKPKKSKPGTRFNQGSKQGSNQGGNQGLKRKRSNQS